MLNGQCRKKWLSKVNKMNLFAIITGLIAGLVNGVFGGGGGMIVVPMLTNLLKCKQKLAHATAILIILPLSIVSGLFYAAFGDFNLRVGVPTGLGVIIGGIVGALLLKKLSSKIVVVLFSVLMAAAGVKMLFF
jgi:uncharacterized membrane protein YfcA